MIFDFVMDRIREFKAEKILLTDASVKLTVILGNIDGEPCLLKLSRLALPEFKLGEPLPITSTTGLDTNGIYSWGTGALEEQSSCYFDLVFPATDKHIAKYTVAPKHMVTETPQDYETIVAPYIDTQKGSRIDWVRGILDDGVEADKVVFRDDDFVLLPNSKWDQKTVDSLYLLALVCRKDLASIRDLNQSHIPLLEHIRDESKRVAQEKWGVQPNQIKTYLHYQPSYYHLHVHVVNVELEQHDFGRSLFLDNVIDMLRVRPICEATLTYIMSETHDLFKELVGK